MWISKKKLAEIKAEVFEDGKRANEAGYQQLHNNYQKLSRENLDLTKKIREQSRADMIFEAIKVIVGGIKEPITASLQPELYNQYAAMQAAQAQYQGCLDSGLYTNLIGGILRQV